MNDSTISDLTPEPAAKPMVTREFLFKWGWISISVVGALLFVTGQYAIVTRPVFTFVTGCDAHLSDEIRSENGRVEARIESLDCDRFLGERTRVRVGSASSGPAERLADGPDWTLLTVDGPYDEVSIEWDRDTLVVYYPDDRDVTWKGQAADGLLGALGADVVYIPMYD